MELSRQPPASPDDGSCRFGRSSRLPTLDAAAAARIVADYSAGASIRELAQSTGQSRSIIRALLAAAGITPAPKGGGRPRLSRRHQIDPELSNQISTMYLTRRMTRSEIAAALGVSEHRVRTALQRAGVPARTRGRLNREDRTRVSAEVLRGLYVGDELTVAQVAERLATTPAIISASLREHAIPVRSSAAHATDERIAVLAELYRDHRILDILDRHGVPRRTTTGQLAERFPQRASLTEPLLRDLYETCGLSTVHIELLTGQPAVEVTRHLAGFDIPRRSPGGLSPWRQRRAK
jgi:transposase